MKPRKPEPQRPQITLSERISRYMANVEPSISGQNGHDAAFRAACKLVIGFCLSEAEALPHMREWNQRCSPPWEDRDLERKLREAMKARQRNPAQAGQLLGNVRDYARGTTPRPSPGPQAARSPAAVPPPTSAPKAGRSLPFLVAGAASPSPSAVQAEQPVPSAPAPTAPSLPASVLAAVRASVALWADQNGEQPDTIFVPPVTNWPATVEGMKVVVESELKEIQPARTGEDAGDGCGATPISARTRPHTRG